MSKLSEFLKKIAPPQVLDLGTVLLSPYVPAAKSLGRSELTRKVAIPFATLERFRKLDTAEKIKRAQELRDAQAKATVDLVLFLADAE